MIPQTFQKTKLNIQIAQIEFAKQSRSILTQYKMSHSLLLVNSAYWVIFHAFLLSADFFLKSTFLKNYFRSTIRVSNSLDPDQAGQNVGPDLGPNCLQRLSADDTRRL